MTIEWQQSRTHLCATIALVTRQPIPEYSMNDQNRFATAHQAWDQRWTDESVQQDWLTPEPLVVDALPLLRRRNVQRVVDIGCGIGRHALFLATEGYDVTGIDLSQHGLETARTAARSAGVDIDYRIGNFTDLPLPDSSVDLALAWNVIYHGDSDVVKTAIAEIQRVLKPGGLFLGTMISKRHTRFGDGTEIRPNTFIVDDDDEKAHAHFYCNDRELVDLLSGFQLFHLQDREQREPGTWHWEFLAEMLEAS
jgi:tellurite methyltransferase